MVRISQSILDKAINVLDILLIKSGIIFNF